MKKRLIPINCSTRTVNLVAYDIDPNGEDAERVNQLLTKARQHGASAHSPSGRIRSPEELIKKRYLGFLSEDLIAEHLQLELGPEINVSNKDFETHDDHVDIEIHAGGKTINVEVRSSFPYSRLDRVVCVIYDVIGPYSTARKSGESLKDFYLYAFINEAVEKFSFQREHTLYFAAGAPNEWFFMKEKVRPDDLKQEGADYLLIPIVKAMDAVEVVKEIRRTVSNV